MSVRPVLLPRPVVRKLEGLNLPERVEAEFVDAVIGRVMAMQDVESGTLCVEASFPGDDDGEWYDAYGWVAYTFDEGNCVVTDLGVDFIPQHG